MPNMASTNGYRVGLFPSILIFVMMALLHGNCRMVDGRNISAEEYLQMKAKLQSLNKPAIKTIQTEYGDLYDCVDIYKQPAFDHPLLRNHKIQMEPSEYPKGRITNHTTLNPHTTVLKDGGCPNGTVPIRRTRMEDLMRAESLEHYGKKGVTLTRVVMHAHAIARAPAFRDYYGARAYINVWNPKLANDHEFSLAQMWLTAGPNDDLNSIEVGWIVNPIKYGDRRTRLFVYWTADGYHQTGCFNLDCPGFVHLNPHIVVDMVIDRVSHMRDFQYDMKIDVFRDPKTGNWHLLKDDLPIGYWPNSIFTSLRSRAQNIDWGGEVTQCPNCDFPEMGSGLYAASGYGYTAYMQELQVIENTEMVLHDVKDCSTACDRPKCFSVLLNPVLSGRLRGYHITYGGPGGNDC